MSAGCDRDRAERDGRETAVAERLGRWIDAHCHEMVQFARRLIRIPSVNRTAEARARRGVDTACPPPNDSHPFGIGVTRCLEAVWRAAEAAGMTVRRYPGIAGHVEIGSGPELVGVLTHVDVVPAGTDWSVPPFEGRIRDGRLYGRGAVDNKGPLAASFYALRAIHELHLPCRRRARLIVGGDEEGRWRCMEYYFAREPRPETGFSPDGLFPWVGVERGIVHLRLVFPWQSSHGLLVIEPGENPGRGLSISGWDDEKSPVARFLAARLQDSTGGRWGVAADDPVSGSTTVAVEHVFVRRSELQLDLAVRYPISTSGAVIADTISREVQQVGGRVEEVCDKPPHRVSCDAPLVGTLRRVYEQHTGLPGIPRTANGASFARYLGQGVAFGPVFPGEPMLAHEPDEYMAVHRLRACAHMYALAIYELIKETS